MNFFGSIFLKDNEAIVVEFGNEDFPISLTFGTLHIHLTSDQVPKFVEAFEEMTAKVSARAIREDEIPTSIPMNES